MRLLDCILCHGSGETTGKMPCLECGGSGEDPEDVARLRISREQAKRGEVHFGIEEESQ